MLKFKMLGVDKNYCSDFVIFYCSDFVIYIFFDKKNKYSMFLS